MVDDADYEALLNYSWIHHKNGNTAYASTRFYGPNDMYFSIDMHRAIMGVTDPKILVDHADGNGLNNQRSNLRICNRSQNAANHNYTKKEWTTSKHFGVSWMPKAKRWRAYTTKNKKQISLGLYLREEDAAKAYNDGAIKYHGEFAKLNVIA